MGLQNMMRSLVAAALFVALFAALVPRASASGWTNYVNTTTTYYTDKDCKTRGTAAAWAAGEAISGQFILGKCLKISETASMKGSGSCSAATVTSYTAKGDCTGASTSVTSPAPPAGCIKSTTMTTAVGADTWGI